MASKRFEGSAADRVEDKRNAKKHGITVKAWEKSPGDRKADAAGQRTMDRKAKARKRKHK